jgi:TonB family protein
LLLMAILPVATFAWLSGGVRIVLVPAGFPGLTTAGATYAWEKLAVAAWLAGVLALALRTAGGLLLIERLRRSARPLPADWARRCHALHRRMSGPVGVLFAQSEAIAAPIVAGWLKPMVLIPVAALARLPVEQLEALILHELAHVRRLDAFANLVQTAVETALFYHPAVWWVSRRIRVEREHCCDDLALAAVRDPVLYVRALQALDALRVEPAPALAANGGDLRRRVARILGVATVPARPALSPAAAVLVLSLAAVALTQGASVQARPSETPAAPAPAAARLVGAMASGASVSAQAPPMRRIVLTEALAAPAIVAPTLADASTLAPRSMILALAAPDAPPASLAAASAIPPISGLTVTGQPLRAKADATVAVGVRAGGYVAVWPTDALHVGWDGKVRLTCLIDVHGLAERCQVVSETPANKHFGKAALELRPTFKLTPLERSDGPVDSWMTIDVAFYSPGPSSGSPTHDGYAANDGGEGVGGASRGDYSGPLADGAGGVSIAGRGNGQPMRQITMLDFPVWTAAPDFDDLARAYPAKGGGVEGYVAAHCHVLRTGELEGCFAIKEAPEGHGFGKAGLSLTGKFRVARDLATASHPTPLWVDVPIRFPPPAAAGERSVSAPIWLNHFDPRRTPQVFPPEAAAQGLVTGRGIARCVVAADGALTRCAPDPDEPDSLGFSAAAAHLASAMKMNLWSADGAPVEGGVVHVPIRLNLKADAKAPARGVGESGR